LRRTVRCFVCGWTDEAEIDGAARKAGDGWAFLGLTESGGKLGEMWVCPRCEEELRRRWEGRT
jgi:rubredoxin